MKLTYTHIIQSHLHHIQAEVSIASYSQNAAGWVDELVPEFYRFCFIEKGTAWLQLGGHRHIVKAGQLALLPISTHESFGNDGDETLGRYWCQFRANLGDIKLFELLNLPLQVTVDDHAYVEAIFVKMIAAFKEDSLTSGLRLKAALLELLSYYLERCDLREESLRDIETFAKLGDVLAYIERNMGNSIQVEELAKIAYLHPNYFIEIFKSLVGCSPIHYVNKRKLEYARELLEQSDDHVAEIANQIGMQNHYLSRLFKQYTGLSPSSYRKKYREAHKMKGAGM